MMPPPPKLLSAFPYLIILSLVLLYLYSSTLNSHSTTRASSSTTTTTVSPSCNLFQGQWVINPISTRKPSYDETCPFHRNSWNCLKNQRDNMGLINSWQWAPKDCDLPRVDPERAADHSAKKWKKKGAWRGAYFPKFNVTVAYHRAVLLAKYQWLPKQSSSDNDGREGIHRIDVDIPADDWAGVTDFYDVLVFNTSHWWGYDKFPKEKPLVFYRAGKPIHPPLGLLDGLKVVLDNMVPYIEKEVPSKTLKFWRLQSPRHFYGGDWNQNGSCLFTEPLKEHQLDSWFDPSNNGVNKEARVVNRVIEEKLRGTDIHLLDLTHLSRCAPTIWLGKKGCCGGTGSGLLALVPTWPPLHLG